MASSLPFGSSMWCGQSRRAQWALLLGVAVLAHSIQLEPSPHAGPKTVRKKIETAPAAVFTETDDSLKGSAKGYVAAELARFVTAYKQGFETLIDVTPHSLLLKAAADKSKKVNFYVFVDTWVNNDTSTSLYLNNETGRCSPLSSSQGNGFAFTAELLLWGRAKRLDTRPKRSVTLAPGYFGGRYSFGNVEVLEGTVTSGQSILLDKPLRGSAIDFAAPPPVYECSSGTAGVHHAALLGYAATEVVHFERYLKVAKPSAALEMTARKNLARSLVEALVKAHLVPLTKVTGGHASELASHHIRSNITVATAHFDHSQAQPIVGTKVYYDSGIATDHYDPRMRRWVNASYPFEPVGTVVAVKGSKLTLHLVHSCLPKNATSGLPKFVIPSSARVVPDAEALIASSFRRGQKLVQEWHENLHKKQFRQASAANVDGYARFGPEPGQFMEPLLLESKGHLLRPPVLIGRLSLEAVSKAKAEAEAKKKKGQTTLPLSQSKSSPELGITPVAEELELRKFANTRACIVVQRHQGHLFTRGFDLGSIAGGERVLAQLTVTGHGWAATSEQCGEYCHAVYHMVVNGKTAANVTQFRDDCSQNPISDQYGTWQESRNGWCPGSVEHGLYLDVTHAVKSGDNEMTLSASVWSHQRQRYEPYTNFAGFVFQDDASLTVDLNLFVYGANTVKRILKQGKPFTEAEVALFHGSSHRAALKPTAPTPPTGEAAAAALLEPPRIASQRIEAISPNRPHQTHAEQQGAFRQRLMRSETPAAEAKTKVTPNKETERREGQEQGASRAGNEQEKKEKWEQQAKKEKKDKKEKEDKKDKEDKKEKEDNNEKEVKSENREKNEKKEKQEHGPQRRQDGSQERKHGQKQEQNHEHRHLKVEERKVEQHKVEQHKAEERKVEQHKVEQHKVEQHKAGQHKVEKHKAEEHKVEQHKAEQRKVQPHRSSHSSAASGASSNTSPSRATTADASASISSSNSSSSSSDESAPASSSSSSSADSEAAASVDASSSSSSSSASASPSSGSTSADGSSSPEQEAPASSSSSSTSHTSKTMKEGKNNEDSSVATSSSSSSTSENDKKGDSSSSSTSSSTSSSSSSPTSKNEASKNKKKQEQDASATTSTEDRDTQNTSSSSSSSESSEEAAEEAAAAAAASASSATTEDEEQQEEEGHPATLATEPYDFPSRSPWFQFDEVNEGTLGAKVVPVFSQALLQSDTRTVWGSLDASLLADYAQVALRLKLESPEGLDIDDWDRQASFGLILRKGAQDAVVHVADPPMHRKVPLTFPHRTPQGAVPLPEPSMFEARHDVSD